MTGRICGKATRVPVHPSVVVGGATVGTCEKECLPTMTVCEEHATPDAVRMLANHLSKELEMALKCARVEAHNFDEARAEAQFLRAEVDRLNLLLEERWADCHDGSEQACCKSHE